MQLHKTISYCNILFLRLDGIRDAKSKDDGRHGSSPDFVSKRVQYGFVQAPDGR